MDDAVPALAEYRQEADEGDYRGNCDCERRLLSPLCAVFLIVQPSNGSFALSIRSDATNLN